MSDQTQTAAKRCGCPSGGDTLLPLPYALGRVCDTLDFFYRLTHNVMVEIRDRRLTVPVEVKLHFRLARCRGPLAIGDLLYTTTLLPGEKVKLFTSDRRTQFSFDSSSSLSYRNTQSSEESMYLQSMSDSVLDTNELARHRELE